MNMNERISNADYDTLVNYVCDVGYGRSEAVPALLSAWDEAKSNYLFELFGDKLIHEKEITIIKPDAVMREDFRNIYMDYRTLFSNIDDIIRNANYYLTRRKSIAYWNWNSDICPVPDEVYSNIDLSFYMEDSINPFNLTLMEDVYLIKDSGARIDHWKDCISYYMYDNAGYIEEDVKKTIPNGTKIGRFLNKTILPLLKTILMDNAEKYDELAIAIEKFITVLSMLNQNNKMSGTLCVSIHPMDYYTMSDNSYDWCSCMSWSNDGEFKCGTLEMCNSKNIVVAYLKGSEEFEGWNSKRWRELFYIDEDIILGIKGYPYSSKELEAEVFTMLRELAETNKCWEYINDTPEYTRRDVSFILEDKKYFWNIEFNKMYNDCYSEHPVLIGRFAESHLALEPSGPAYSITSGKLIAEDAPEFMLSRPEELGFVRCEKCGCWIESYDSHCYDDYDNLCEDCYWEVKDEEDKD